MIYKTPMQLIEELRMHYHDVMVDTTPTDKWVAFGNTLDALTKTVKQLENKKEHFQGMCLRVFQFLDEHYPDAPGEFDIIENGGELE